MDKNKDALDDFNYYLELSAEEEDVSTGYFGVYISLSLAETIRNALQTQAELVEACNEAHKWLAAKRDRPSLCGMGHEDYAKTLIVILEKALARAEGEK